MEITDYVDFKTALALKKAGFNEPCDSYYSGNGSIAVREDPECFNFYKDRSICSRPALWQAQKWLREKKKIDVLVYNCACGYLWEVSKANNGTDLILFDEKGDDADSGCWTTYEGAISAGIEQAIKLINLKD